MGRPSKFSAERVERILQAKRVGASNRTAALVAGISESVLRDWLKRGEDGADDSRYRAFWEQFQEAAAHPRERALGIIYNALPDRPDLAWKFVERSEEGYAPPIAASAPAIAQPVNITLSFFETDRSALGEVIEGEVVDEQSEPEGAAAESAPQLAARSSSKPA